MPAFVSNPKSPLVAVYCDQGAWPAGREAVEHMLTAHHQPWQRANAHIVNTGALEKFDVFWLPGGWSGDYWSRLSTQGMENLRQFVRQGGRFVGVCAGAFFASTILLWEGESFDYPIGLFAGQTAGPIAEIAPWPRCAMTAVNLDPEHPINASLSPTRQQLYYGGPTFVPHRDQPVDVIATYAQTGEPAAIVFQYGAGQVFLGGLHFEIGPDCVGQENSIQGIVPPLQADWEFGWAVLDWLLRQKD